MPVGNGWELPQGLEPWSTFRWFKISPRGVIDVIVLSESPVWYVGHYSRDRMWPCQGAGCSMCADGLGRQVRYVFAVVEVSTRRVGLIELSESVALLVRDWESRNEGLRGMRLEISKSSNSVRSRNVAEFVDRSDGTWWMRLVVPDIRMALELTWEKMGASIPTEYQRPVKGAGRSMPPKLGIVSQ